MIGLQNFPSENYLHNLVKLPNNKLISLSAIGFLKSNINFYNYDISSKLINNYEETRNFPSQETSKIGVFLRFGLVSIRSIVKKAVQSRNDVFLKELIWREFFMQILYHYPETVTKSFKSKYDNIKWRQNDYEFQMWCEGKTGYPLVDAGMRELNTTGFMHNRVRMLVASFLCKHLLIDWRLGEAYFAKKLLDFGAFISFSGIITFKKNNELREVVKYVPEDRILIETDSPYLSPEPHRGKKNTPQNLDIIALEVAKIKNINEKMVYKITTNNFNKIFKLI